MIRITGTVLGGALAVQRLQRLEPKIQAAMAAGMAEGIAQGVPIVKAAASGRPGPTPDSGAHVDGISGDSTGPGVVVEGQVGSNEPYSARLEGGFSGQTDSLGRYYENWGPFPYMAPSAGAVGQACASAIGAQIAGAF